MGEGGLVCSSISHRAKRADVGSCLSLTGATAMAKPTALCVNRVIVAEEGETRRLWAKNSLSIGKVDFTWCEIVL